ncbi:hypothetical protein [Streptomyces sp. SID3343]|uniref:hypothetical protein n=1 Tax=Streptomyces sp. SID3343 TaxID=2690260 RepID=UPI001370463A|nr:hypothetical protein [Streptomyces sp. SID3343]MYW03034.1 hypothetical protein [Streptomyces sp. SID3343]
MNRGFLSIALSSAFLLAAAAPSVAGTVEGRADSTWRYVCQFPSKDIDGNVGDDMRRCEAKNGAQTGWGYIWQPFEIVGIYAKGTWVCDQKKENGAYGEIIQGTLYGNKCRKVA